MSMEAIAQAIAEESTPADPLAGFLATPVEQLNPGQDYLNDTLYYTFPMQKETQKKLGKGKDAPEITTVTTVPIVLTSAGDAFPYDEEMLYRKGFSFPSSYVINLENRWDPTAILNWRNGKADDVDGASIFETIREAYQTHVQYEQDIHYDLVPLYVMGSYIFRMYDAIGYIHFNGTMASGKSQNLKLMSTLGFNGSWSSNMSASALFRTVSSNPGVLCVDEAERFNTERGMEIKELLQGGYLKNNPTKRMEKDADGKYIVGLFETYSPKIIASIAPLDPVLASRCLIINMQPATRTIPEFSDKEQRWKLVRHQLYTWALSNATAIKTTIDEWNTTLRQELAPNLRNRAWQISQVFITMADFVLGREKALEVVEWFSNYFAHTRRNADESDKQRRLLRVLPRVFATHNSPVPGTLLLKHIVEVYREYSEEDDREYIKPKGVGRNLTALGWIDRTVNKAGTCVHITEDEVRHQMRRREVDPYPEDINWLEGRNYQAGTLDGLIEQTTTTDDSEQILDSFSWLPSLGEENDDPSNRPDDPDQ